MRTRKVSVLLLERRLQELEDRLAIYQLMMAYGPAVDSGSSAAAGSLWAESGIYDSGVGIFEGPEGIRAMVATDPHDGYTKAGCAHIVSAPHIELDHDRAVAICYSQLLLRDEATDGFKIWRVTANRWEWERSKDGWRVTKRVNHLLDGNPPARALFQEGVRGMGGLLSDQEVPGQR